MADTPELTRRGVLSTGLLAAVAAGAWPAAASAGGSQPGPTVLASRFGTVGDGSADDTKALQAALDATFGGASGMLVIPPGTYRISDTLQVRLASAGRCQSGISARGAHFYSAIRDGRNIFEFTIEGDTQFVLLEGLDILGTARDGHGIAFECESNAFGLRNFCLRDIVIQHCGGDGIRLAGNLSHGQVINSYFRSNRANGATFSHGRRAGVLSSVHVFGCVFGDNKGYGAALLNGCSDVAFHGCYLLLNDGFGLAAESGCTLLSNCGFENNHQKAASFEHGNAGVYMKKSGTLVACMGFSMLKQTHLIRAVLDGPLTMVGCSGYGAAEAKNAGLAHLAGVSPAAAATLIGCSGAVECESGLEALQIADEAGGIRFGASWQSRTLPRLGDYRLWIDGGGSLRLKKGVPTADDDGAVVGAEALRSAGGK